MSDQVSTNMDVDCDFGELTRSLHGEMTHEGVV
jgi:hypothetical protein